MMAMSSLSIFVLTFFMQELPTEVKEEYLRKAVLFMQVHLKIGKVSPDLSDMFDDISIVQWVGEPDKYI